MAGLKLENKSSSDLIPRSPRSGRKLRSNDSHFGPPTAPNKIESQFLASLIVSSGKGDPVSS